MRARLKVVPPGLLYVVDTTVVIQCGFGVIVNVRLLIKMSWILEFKPWWVVWIVVH